MNTYQILVKARELVKKGWGQASLQQGTKYCALGATAKAAGVLEDGYSELFKLEAVHVLASCVPLYRRMYNNDVRVVYNFNDHRSRTQEDIIALFNRAIEKVAPDFAPTEHIDIPAEVVDQVVELVA